eukprot:6316087-Amphidinium_carterae.1
MSAAAQPTSPIPEEGRLPDTCMEPESQNAANEGDVVGNDAKPGGQRSRARLLKQKESALTEREVALNRREKKLEEKHQELLPQEQLEAREAEVTRQEETLKRLLSRLVDTENEQMQKSLKQEEKSRQLKLRQDAFLQREKQAMHDSERKEEEL